MNKLQKINNKTKQRKEKKNVTRKMRKASKTPKFLLLKTAGGIKKYKLVGVKTKGGDAGIFNNTPPIVDTVKTGIQTGVTTVKEGAVNLANGVGEGIDTIVNVGNTPYNECKKNLLINGIHTLDSVIDGNSQHPCAELSRVPVISK